MKYAPAALGALLVVAGVAFVFWPAALVVAGGFLLVLDNRLSPSPPTLPRTLTRDEAR